MSQNTPEMAPASEGPQGSVPQGVADGIALLAADVAAMRQRAQRAWKTTLLIWVILLAVIFSYLYFGVYAQLQKYLKPDTIVQIGIQQVNAALSPFGVTDIESPTLGREISAKLNAMAPDLIEGQLKPYLQDLKGQLPAMRDKYTALLRDKADDLVDEGVKRLEDQVLPQLGDALVKYVDEKSDALLDQVEADMGRQVTDLVVKMASDTEAFGNQQAVTDALALAMEDAAGEVLDEMFENLDVKMINVKEKLALLIEHMDAGTLTYREKLELRLVQDVRALFEGADLEAQDSGLIDLGPLRGTLAPKAGRVFKLAPKDMTPEEIAAEMARGRRAASTADEEGAAAAAAATAKE